MGANAALYAGAIQASTAVGSGFQQAASAKAQGYYEESQANFNAKLASKQADDANLRGSEAAVEAAHRTNKVLGAQRAALAAQGIDVNSGSAAAVQEDTMTLGHLDQISIQSNAAREAFGFKTQASQYETQGKMAKLSSQNIARNSLITGGLNATAFGLNAYKDWYGVTTGKADYTGKSNAKAGG